MGHEVRYGVLRRVALIALGLISLGFLPIMALAHHSTAAFDSNKSVTLTGTVTEVHWVNPHTYVDLLVTESNGKKTAWSILSGTPTLNVRNGWKYNDIKKGDKVTVVGFPSRNGDSAAIMAHITLADGRTIQGPREFLKAPQQ